MTNILNTNSFLTELNNSYFDKDDEDNICPISFQPFDLNAITLPCKHKYNYEPLYKYVFTLKKNFNRFSMHNLGLRDIMCPMCRNISHQLLPFVPQSDVTRRVPSITSPTKYCMPHRKCCAIIKNGKNRGSMCNRDGYHTKHGDVCERHDIILKPPKKNKQPTNSVIQHNVSDMNPAIAKIWSKYTVCDLKKLLRVNYLPMTGNKEKLIVRILDNNIVL